MILAYQCTIKSRNGSRMGKPHRHYIHIVLRVRTEECDTTAISMDLNRVSLDQV